MKWRGYRFVTLSCVDLGGALDLIYHFDKELQMLHGQTDHARRRITLSRHLMALYKETEVRETILHEIAHARVGAAHGHDAVWAAEARRIGSSGQRLVAEHAPRIEGRWVGTCPAGHTINRMRRPAAPMACARCGQSFRLDHLLSWTYDGAPMTPERIGERYARILARVRRSQA